MLYGWDAELFSRKNSENKAPPLILCRGTARITRKTTEGVPTVLVIELLRGLKEPPLGLAGHLTALRAWCKQCLRGRHAPSRHCRDAKVYGHTIPAMHEIEYISPIEYPPPPAAVRNILAKHCGHSGRQHKNRFVFILKSEISLYLRPD